MPRTAVWATSDPAPKAIPWKMVPIRPENMPPDCLAWGLFWVLEADLAGARLVALLRVELRLRPNEDRLRGI